MKNTIKEIVIDEKGQGVAEYGLIISLLILAGIGAVRTFGEELIVFYDSKIADKLP